MDSGVHRINVHSAYTRVHFQLKCPCSHTALESIVGSTSTATTITTKITDDRGARTGSGARRINIHSAATHVRPNCICPHRARKREDQFRNEVPQPRR